MAKLFDAAMKDLPDPVFSEPWHAHIFAMTVHLSEAKLFTWPDWADAFSQTRRRHGLTKTLDGGNDYYLAWLETLEGFLKGHGVSPEKVEEVRQAWETAYLTTPHGTPVRLPRSGPRARL